MSSRCQLCDGPVAGGRCTLCGMPYRNDAVLYHLNENQSEHYRHASRKAREEMIRRQVPVGDTAAQHKKQSAGRPVPGISAKPAGKKGAVVSGYDKLKVRQKAQKEFGSGKKKKSI